MSKRMQQDKMMQSLTLGRTMEQQMDWVREHGNHGAPPGLRNRVVNAIGAGHNKTAAENVIHFGCYIPFRFPFELRAYFTLLDRLGIEYAFLPKEYCCGDPWIELAEPEELPRAKAGAQGFMDENQRMAKELGAKNIVYMCLWCAAIGKQYLGDGTLRQMFYPDLVVEQFRDRQLEMPPAAIGYYEGCRSRVAGIAPGLKMDFDPYREIMSRVRGLTVVDLGKECCVGRSKEIVQKAQSEGLDTIVTACPACHSRLGLVSPDVRVKYYPELLLAAADGTAL